MKPSPATARTAIFYALTATGYVIAGVAFPDLLLSSFEGIGVLVLGAWAVPAGTGRAWDALKARRALAAGDAS